MSKIQLMDWMKKTYPLLFREFYDSWNNDVDSVFVRFFYVEFNKVYEEDDTYNPEKQFIIENEDKHQHWIDMIPILKL